VRIALNAPSGRYVVKHILRMRGVPLPLKAINEAPKAKMERIVMKY